MSETNPKNFVHQNSRLMHSSKMPPKHRRALHPDQVEELREAFNLFDGTGKGFLDCRELKAAVRAVGYDVKKEQVRKMVCDIGKDPSQHILFEDFVAMMRDKLQEKGTREDVMKIFNLFDEEQLGKITFRNLKRIAVEIGEPVTDEELREMIEEADKDGDGALNFEEFYRVMKRRNDDPLNAWDSSDED